MVLLFHLDIDRFAGGYLGVDLFFVISGFIITRNILYEQQRNSFTLREFYIRRFRRLFPALVVTVLLTLVAGMFIISPVELVESAKSALFALFSLANFHFWKDTGYFHAAAHTKPLLHTWSLSVEEQFYLLWPSTLLLLARTRWLVQATLVLLALSLLPALLLQDSHSPAVFYLLPFRVHQLMAGAIVAIASLRARGMSGNLLAALGAAGFALACVLPGHILSPAEGAALVSGVGLLLLLGMHSAFAQRLFTNAPMLWIGKRSYALYLVHWPIIVLYKFAEGFRLDWREQFLMLAASLVAAVCLHEIVEKPFRYRNLAGTWPQRATLPLTLSALVIAIVSATCILRYNGSPFSSPTLIQNVVHSADEEKELRLPAIRMGQCDLHRAYKIQSYDIQGCATPDPERTSVLIIGDSHAADIYMIFSRAYPDVQFLQATAGGCVGLLRIAQLQKRYPTCVELSKLRFFELAHRDVDLVILASAWSEENIEPLAQTVDYLHSLGRRVLVIGPRSTFEGGVPLLAALSHTTGELKERIEDNVVDRSWLLRAMRKALKGTEVIDFGAIQCTPECAVMADNRLLYVDEGHLTTHGAEIMAARFRERFDLRGFITAQGSP